MLINNQWITEEIRGSPKIPEDKLKQQHNNPNLLDSAKAVPKEVYCNTSTPQETKISKQQSNISPKRTIKRRTSKTQS